MPRLACQKRGCGRGNKEVDLASTDAHVKRIFVCVRDNGFKEDAAPGNRL
jgi:hypothetical protein